MARKEDRYAGWRPTYSGVVDRQGYSLETLEFDSPDFPKQFELDPKRGHTFQWRKGGYTFIVPNSGTFNSIRIEGSSNSAYLDLLNLECSNSTGKKIEAFLNNYGTPLYSNPLIAKELRKPHCESTIFLTVEYLLELSRSLRELVYDTIGNNNVSILPGPKHRRFDHERYKVSIDLKTSESIVEAEHFSGLAFLQIADIFSRGLRITNCEICNSFMTPSRSTRLYCGNTCAKSASRANAAS